MTVGIVAIAEDDKHIVVACDRMLSHGDIIQAADDGALKARRIAKKWGITFAGDASKFKPVVDRAFNHLPDINGDCSEQEVRNALISAYREELECMIVANLFSRIGYTSTAEFLKSGLSQLGDAVFQSILRKTENADLGITFLVHGFDKLSTPHVFQISNPGAFVSHDLIGCAAIGSGIYMATASLRRRPPKGSLESTVYRVLEAKFSSETANGVGRSTSLLIQNSEGNGTFLSNEVVEKIRASWLKVNQRPDPKSAIDYLAKLNIARLIIKHGVDTSPEPPDLTFETPKPD
jgi:20S proteasome alpha/beta subunit